MQYHRKKKKNAFHAIFLKDIQPYWWRYIVTNQRQYSADHCFISSKYKDINTLHIDANTLAVLSVP